MYYSEALEFYSLAEKDLLQNKKYDLLTNLYFNMAWSSYKVGKVGNACKYYDKTLNAYENNIKLNPNSKPFIPSGYGSFQEYLGSRKKGMKCNDSV